MPETIKGVKTPKGFLQWIARGVKSKGAKNAYAVAQSILKKATKEGVKALVKSYTGGLAFDPQKYGAYFDPDNPFDIDLHPKEALLRLVANPRPSKRPQLMEIQVTIDKESYDFLKVYYFNFFTETNNRLIRRGSDPRPTGIFLDRG